ncbi:MAG TPA: amino acid adenylation domain-containing protein, partial [Candidatus Deferrimicrobium sp.]|nr:amino acid adenylation domain-containing protein [Candidatus Deferrimicrobium sp.]
IIGMFVNTLALRNYPEGHKGFMDFLTEIKKRTLEAFENQDYQFEDLVEKVSVNRDPGRNPIFDTVFTLQNLADLDKKTSRLETTQLNIKPHEIETGIAKFDLTLTCMESDEKLVCSFDYCTKLFKEETIQRFITYFEQVVAAIIEDKNREISTIEIITAAEKKQILYEFNNLISLFPKEKTIVQLFEELAAVIGDRIAVVDRGQAFTYRILNEIAGQLAGRLIETGVEPNTIVGLLVERSLEMIAGILGIWKAGCAYLPLNPGNPAERIDFMLKDCRVKVLVTAADLADLIEKKQTIHCHLAIINCELLMSGPRPSFHHSSCIIRHSNHPANLAYLIYTSGSTGNPKGVLITHANLSPLLHWGYRNLGIGVSDRALQNLSYYFDWSVWEMFIVLTSGASLYMVSGATLLDAAVCVDFINRHGVTILHITPTQYRYIVKAPTMPMTLRYLFIGAEKLTLDLVERSFENVNSTCRVFNMYGPTEATIISAVLEIEREKLKQFSSLSSIPIGRPVGNTTLLILDKYLNVCPVHIAGELYIGGDGVSQGYLNNPELTSEKFNRSYQSYKTHIFYKTGDLARWLPGGNIEYLGRLDEQVKIRGFRIECGEIEALLLKKEEIKEAVVIDLAGDNSEKYLCAYIVFKAGVEENVTGLKEYLSQTLPNYMIPAFFIKIEKIPLNPNGKLEKKALPAPGLTTKEELAAPENEIEMKLVEIWSGILGIAENKISITGNFFELGGHSLKATVMVSLIHKEFNVKMQLTEIFTNPTIRELAAYIESLQEEIYTSLEPVEKKEYYLLSPAQKRMFVLQQMVRESTVYNMPQSFLISGELNFAKLKTAFSKLLMRHESLRTSFHMIENEPAQRVHDEVEFQIEPLGRGAPPWSPSIPTTPFIRPFDLSRAPLIRVGLLKNAETEYMMMVDMHHIISDGVSHGILAEDFFTLYNGGDLEPIRIQYKDFSQWQNSAKEQEKIKKQESYWLKEFAGEIPVLNLFTDFPRPPVQSFAGSSLSFESPADVMNTLRHIAVTGGVTVYMVLLAVYNILLSKLTGREDIIVGTPIAGRRHADLEKIIGMFVNTLALRNYPEGHKGFIDFLTDVKKRTLEAFENQDYPFEDLVEKVSVNRDPARNPIFDTVFALQNLADQDKKTSPLNIKPHEIETTIAKFDLTLTCMESEEKLVCSFEYCTKLFKDETIQHFITYFEQVVAAIIEDRNREISTIEIITAAEKEQILYRFNNLISLFPREKSIVQLFEELAAGIGDRIAVVDRGQAFSYRLLNEIAGQLAGRLIETGVEPHTIVGLLVERSLEMIAGILGTWKTGCAYLPLNPGNPAERIDFMLKDCRVKVLITAADLADLIEKEQTIHCQLVVVNCELLKSGPRGSFHPLSCILHSSNHPDNLAYLIYTSGSTGNPKGVLITHGNLSPLLHWGYKNLGIGVSDRALQNLSYYFDWSVWEMFIVLTSGASLYLVSGATLLDAAVCVDFINCHGVTILHITPTQYRYIVKAPTVPMTLRYLFIGAEKLTFDLVERSFENVNSTCRVFNMYGPTEATIISAVLEIQREKIAEFKSLGSIPIGKPAGNTMLLIMDKYLNVCPVHIAGELYIGGDGVSQGYLNNPELTAEKFGPQITLITQLNRIKKTKITKSFGKSRNPFSKGFLAAGGIFYKTGDLARWLPDGNIEYLGRLDEQVKIRGFRIELGEIEALLLKKEEIKEAVVIDLVGDNSEKYLCAYIVFKAGVEENMTGLKEYLSQTLPNYMIPAFFIKIEKIPLNPNGKIDRKALPAPGLTIKEEFAAPENEIEMKLVEIWSGILGIAENKIGIAGNFFELGGHSLKATVMVSVIHKEFNVKMQLTEIFTKPTIRELAAHIGGLREETYTSLEPVEKKEYYLLSPAQKRMFVLQQMVRESTVYNMPQSFLISGELNFAKLETTFSKLLKRHESLRTSFHMIENEPVQRVHDEVEFGIEYYDLATDTLPQHGQNFIRPFELSRAPLIRVGLLKKAETEYLMMADMHHIISDGVSHDILAEDFFTLYNGGDLEPVPIQYKDFSQWQNSVKEQEKIKKQESYWLKEFAGEIPVLNLFTDFPRPPVQSFSGSSLNFESSAAVMNTLRLIAVTEGVTVYMVLLAVYNILLSKLTGREDIIVGT